MIHSKYILYSCIDQTFLQYVDHFHQFLTQEVLRMDTTYQLVEKNKENVLPHLEILDF